MNEPKTKRPAAVWLFALIALEGLAAAALLFGSASEQQSALLWGLSAPRLAVAGLLLFFVFLCGLSAVLLLVSSQKTQPLTAALAQHLESPALYFSLLALCAGLFLTALAAFFLFSLPVARQLEMLTVVFGHLRAFIAWMGLCGLQAGLLVWFSKRRRLPQDWPSGRWSALGAFTLLAFAVISLFYLLCIYFRVEFNQAETRFNYQIFTAFSGLLILWSALERKNPTSPRLLAFRRALPVLLIFTATFLFYRTSSLAIGRINTPAKSYFNELAYAMTQGKLYLENPHATMDLTLYKGNWYVAFPPLAAILMLPEVILRGSPAVNTITFSAFFGAISAALVYMMLNALTKRGWSKLHPGDNLWLVILFAAGTIHWYTANAGTVWHINRILTVTFTALAVVLVLYKKPAWLVGLAFGLAIGARPNIVFIWLFLFGIAVQTLHENGSLRLRPLAAWVVQSAIPISLAVLGLLFYNQIRFDNPFDFGYATMNVGINVPVIQAYGQFHPAFIGRNLYYMWLRLPYLSRDCLNRLVPDPQGISLLVTTPAIVYLVKAFKRSYWVIGAWAALLLEIALLSTHTGYASEFGYRFVLDFIIPVVALLAVAAGKKVSWFMRCLILIGVAVNLWGVLWAFDLWCPV